MKKVIIFGAEDFASLAHFYLNEDSDYEVAGFAISQEYLQGREEFEGLPLFAFENIEETLDSNNHSFFVPMSHRGMNSLREKVFQEVSEKGYEMISYVSSKATVFSNVEIGANCFILEDNTLQPFVSVGDNVVLWSGNHVGHHSSICDGAFVTSHVVISGHCVIGERCFIGVNATLKDGITLGTETFIAMGSVVTGDTDPCGVYKGHPAKKTSVESSKIC